VATVLAAQARRPGDLASRYGGEEFALLLPGTDAEGCELVGMRFCDALRDIQIPHGSNPPSRLVTASLGGATIWPNANTTTDCASLVGAADRALYSAKDGGRDRMVMSGRVLPWPRARSA
jgi:diguanylate cyclase (GGDEF)-like protein